MNKKEVSKFFNGLTDTRRRLREIEGDDFAPIKFISDDYTTNLKIIPLSQQQRRGKSK
jgi:hypothetical protein